MLRFLGLSIGDRRAATVVQAAAATADTTAVIDVGVGTTEATFSGTLGLAAGLVLLASSRLSS